MATFDRLPAEQRAIIELVLQRGQTYEELSGMLGMPAARVRELARDALGQLAPRTADRVDSDWRGQIADYILGQQSGPESTATRGHLKRSEPARVWAMSLLDSLAELYPNGSMPEIPEAGANGGAAAPAPPPSAPEPEAGPPPGRRDLGGRLTAAVEGVPAPGARPSRQRAPLSPEAHRAVVRRRIIAGAVALVALTLILLWVFGVFGGGSDNKPSSGTAAGGQQKLVEVASLKAQGGADGAGVAAVFKRGNTNTLVVQAAQLKPTGQKTAYEVWLYNSSSDNRAVGAQLTDKSGNLQAAGTLPSNYQRFNQIVMSRERIGTNPKAPTDIILKGRLQPVPANAQQGLGTATAPSAPGSTGSGTTTTP